MTIIVEAVLAVSSKERAVCYTCHKIRPSNMQSMVLTLILSEARSSYSYSAAIMLGFKATFGVIGYYCLRLF